MYKKGWKYLDEAGDQGGDAGGAGDQGGDAGDQGDQGDKGGKWPDTWRQELAGEDVKALKQLERYQSPKDIWNKARALEQRISSGELRSSLPKDASPEQVNAWRSENGIPEAPDKYDIKFGDGGLPEADQPVISEVLKVMHSKNLNNDQAKSVVDWYYDAVARQAEERQEKDKEFAAQAQEELRAEWGADYKPNVNMINGLVSMAPPEVQDLIKGARLGNGDPFLAHPGAMQWLAGMARTINPVTTIIPGAGANIGSAIDDEITSIEKLMATDRKAYNADEKKQSRLRDLYDARERLGKTK